MRLYEVDPNEFYTVFPPDAYSDVEGAMRQLIDRYDIRGKNILSVGSGTAFEEHYLWKLGDNTLTFVDIDEGNGIEPALKRMAQHPGGLAYYVGDAREFFAARSASEKTIDVAYFSGFTPDEFHRDGTLRDSSPQIRNRKRVGGLPEDQWAIWQDPFCDIVAKACGLLRAGGLLIVQSYCGGVDAVYNESFLPAGQRQLSDLGLDLLEVHRFAKTTGVNLIVAQVRGGRPLTPTGALTRFHGRAAPEAVERIWPKPDPAA